MPVKPSKAENIMQIRAVDSRVAEERRLKGCCSGPAGRQVILFGRP
jgi:hypothetical protein